MEAKILYVDDEKDLIEVGAIFFAEEGLPIDTCNGYEEALELISKKRYDLIITDLKMPRGSGVDLIKKARERGHFNGKVILVTGHFDSIDVDEVFDMAVFKPVDFLGLVNKARLLLSF